ncbi:type III secretion inner rod protein HrpB2 [Paraburkholderia atlantica]|uniref:type III secretion protein HrpB2 n=1 Tax=Paraburkholderia atlantica TaxID=2654982 RepID=UPI003D22E24D
MSISIEALQMRAALDSLAQGGSTGGTTPTELASRFESMMQGAHLEAPVASTPSGMQTAAKVLATQDAELQRIPLDAQALVQAVPIMSMQQLSASATTLMLNMSTEQLDLQAKMGVVQSTKSAIETLMKNQ